MDWKFLLALTVGISVVAAPLNVYADETETGAKILSCFHPVSKFSSADLGSPYSSDGYTVVDGIVNFLGYWSDNRYHMKFTILIREVNGSQEFRVVPGEDTAPFPPDEDCRIRSWTPFSWLPW